MRFRPDLEGTATLDDCGLSDAILPVPTRP